MDTEILSVDKIIEAFKANYPDTVFFWEHKTSPGWYVRTSQGPRKIKNAETEKAAYMSAIKYMNFTHDMAREYWKAKNSQPVYKTKRAKSVVVKRYLIDFKVLDKNHIQQYLIVLSRDKFIKLFGNKKEFGRKRLEVEQYATTDWFLRKNKTVFVFKSVDELVNFCNRKNIQITETFYHTKL